VARLVIVTHEFDEFVWWRLKPWPTRQTPYELYKILKQFETFGHSWRTTRGPNPIPGDAALLHVDSTFVDPSYLALKSHYPRALNFGTADISKRTVSSQCLTPEDDWSGPVVVKSNLNHRGLLEKKHNWRALRAGRPSPHPSATWVEEYRLVDRMEDVPDDVWSDPRLIIERFLPEIDTDGKYVYRTWMFMGRHEYCNRFIASHWLVKGETIIAHEFTYVPDELRVERERLNFDYGKFDFVIHNGVPFLMDANRTPGIAAQCDHIMMSEARNLAEGLHKLVTERDGL
jgi:hypothetical protein